MKTILTLLIVALCLVTHAQHAVEIGYSAGLNINKFRFADPSPAKFSMLNSGGIAYRYMGARNVGVSVGLDVSGYKTRNFEFQPYWSTTYKNVQQTYVYLSMPVMMEAIAGKKKTKFIIHSGIVVNYAIWYQLSYTQNSGGTHTNPNQVPTENTVQVEEKRTNLEPLQIGIPLGLGAHIPLSELFYMNITLENRAYIPDIRKSERVDGLLYTVGVRATLGINATKKAKEPKQ